MYGYDNGREKCCIPAYMSERIAISSARIISIGHRSWQHMPGRSIVTTPSRHVLPRLAVVIWKFKRRRGWPEKRDGDDSTSTQLCRNHGATWQLNRRIPDPYYCRTQHDGQQLRICFPFQFTAGIALVVVTRLVPVTGDFHWLYDSELSHGWCHVAIPYTFLQGAATLLEHTDILTLPWLHWQSSAWRFTGSTRVSVPGSDLQSCPRRYIDKRGNSAAQVQEIRFADYQYPHARTCPKDDKVVVPDLVQWRWVHELSWQGCHLDGSRASYITDLESGQGDGGKWAIVACSQTVYSPFAPAYMLAQSPLTSVHPFTDNSTRCIDATY